MGRLGAEADAAFKDIKSELDKPAVPAASPPVALNSPEFPEPVMTPLPVSDESVADAAVLETAKPGKTAKARATRTDNTGVAARTRAPRKPAASAAAKPATSPGRKPRKPKTDT
jgi:sec-independent protein translocase protein TatB